MDLQKQGARAENHLLVELIVFFIKMLNRTATGFLFLHIDLFN
jgi:hypothetical protein